MNPGLDVPPGLGLPQPSSDIGQAPFTHASPLYPSVGSQAPPAPPAYVSPQSAIQQPTQPAPMTPIVPASATSTSDVTEMMDSVDEGMVDQEWVAKAKDVVTRTHTDPYLQSVELSRIKAQYLKVRYNKELKVDEEK